MAKSSVSLLPLLGGVVFALSHYGGVSGSTTVEHRSAGLAQPVRVESPSCPEMYRIELPMTSARQAPDPAVTEARLRALGYPTQEQIAQYEAAEASRDDVMRAVATNSEQGQ